MRAWAHRAPEEKALLNPSFCSLLIWNSAMGHAEQAQTPLPFEASFLVLPMVLHQETREALPKSLATSLAVWLEMNPLSRSRITDRSRMLVPFTKEALTFGGSHGLFRLAEGAIRADTAWAKKVAKTLSTSSEEVRLCAKKADFVGKWFAKTGSASAVLALIGVRP